MIQEKHFINYPDLRKTYCEIQDVLSGISDMGMIEVGPTRTYTLTEFCQEQEDRCKKTNSCHLNSSIVIKKRNMFCHRIQKLDTKLLEFRNLIRETVYDACRSSTKSKEKRKKSLKDPQTYKFSLKEHIL